MDNSTKNWKLTVKDGLYSDSSIWVDGVVPLPDSPVGIQNNVTLDQSITTCGFQIFSGAKLSFDPANSVAIDNCENFIVLGTLQMRPAIPAVDHLIKFHKVDETKVQGGGMDIIDTDPGIWVRDGGILDLQGSPKTAWTNLVGSANKLATSIIVQKLDGWNIGDEISIVPSTLPSISTFTTGFDTRFISSIVGNVLYLNSPLQYDHPMVNGYTAEVINLTRNVRIEGKGDGTANPLTNGRVHINIGMTSNPVNISNVQLRYMGPRYNTPDTYTNFITGRYPFHIHMVGNASNGSIIDGVVVRDSGSHCFVSHASNGITYNNCVTYNTYEEAYWWDTPPADDDKNPINNSNDITYNNCIAALLKSDPSFRGYRLCGFQLGSGLRNTCKNSVAVGNQGNSGAAGFLWPESSNQTDNVWTFDNNISHNNKNDGIFIWENDNHIHIITNFTAYNNGYAGIEQGAYINTYKYLDCKLINNKNGILLHCLSSTAGNIQFERVYSSNPLYIMPHVLPSKQPVIFKNCSFPKVVLSEMPKRVTTPTASVNYFVDCNLKYADFQWQFMELGSVIKVQDSEVAYQIDDKGVQKTIPKFY